MPAAGSKDAPKNHQELKDDTKASREEKLVTVFCLLFLLLNLFMFYVPEQYHE